MNMTILNFGEKGSKGRIALSTNRSLDIDVACAMINGVLQQKFKTGVDISETLMESQMGGRYSVVTQRQLSPSEQKKLVDLLK